VSKHTAGPWRAYVDGDRSPVVQRGRSGGFVVHDTDWERANADALLIAAAPDLLNAIEVLTAAAESFGIPCDAARAAISRARGEA
jgi:hypothetical protein